jgi:hypothetical protein
MIAFSSNILGTLEVSPNKNDCQNLAISTQKKSLSELVGAPLLSLG